MSDPIIQLLPNWTELQRANYTIYRKDHFRYMDVVRQPIENRYPLQIKVETPTHPPLLTVNYPYGVWYLLTSFQPFMDLMGKEEELAKGGYHGFSYHPPTEQNALEVVDINSLKDHLKTKRKQHKKDRELKNALGGIKGKENRLDYLPRDLELIHQTFDAPIPVGLTFNYYFWEELSETQKAAIDPAEKAFLESLGSGVAEASAVKTRIIGHELEVDYLWGINQLMVDSEEHTDFSQIQASFFSDHFDIDAYDKVTLHRKVFRFDLDHHQLTFYRHDMRIVNPNMEKITVVEVKRVGA